MNDILSYTLYNNVHFSDWTITIVLKESEHLDKNIYFSNLPFYGRGRCLNGILG